MSIRIGQASCGESGITEQKPGDQTGRELNFAEWYHGTWLAVLRCCDERQAERAARACEAAIRNKNIGYCQSHRNTLFDAAKRAGWDMAAISERVETDCSALMFCCMAAAGIREMEEIYNAHRNSCTTYCMMYDWPKTGKFERLTDIEYVRSQAFLRRGDVLVSSGHAVMVLEDGPRGREDREMVEQSKLIVDGKEYPAERILKNGVNYIKVRDLAAALGLKVGHKGSIAILERK